MAGGWFYNSRNGAVGEENGILGVISDVQTSAALGWHGPYPSLQAVIDFYHKNAGKSPGWVAPHMGQYLKDYPHLTGVTKDMRQGNGPNDTRNFLQGSAGAAAGTAGSGAYKLVFGNTTGLLSRILKVGIGTVLIVSGLMILSPKVNQDTLGAVTRVAGKLPMVV